MKDELSGLGEPPTIRLTDDRSSSADPREEARVSRRCPKLCAPRSGLLVRPQRGLALLNTCLII